MFLGIDIGGTNIKSAVISEDGSIIFQQSQPTLAQRGKDAVIADMQQIITTLSLRYPAVESVGVGFPSVVNPANGCVYYPPNMPGWEVVPLVSLLGEVTALPIAIDNDANVAALAECELGAGHDLTHFLYVTMGTGVGGCIIAHREIFSGERGGAGEIGHVIVYASEQPTPNQIAQGRAFRAGVMEEYVGRAGIIATARNIMAAYPHSLLQEYGDDLDVEHISQAVEQGDEAACACFVHTGTILGIALSSVLNILDMRVVIVGGGISQSHPLLLDTVQDVLRLRALPTIAPETQVRKAHFSHQAGILGAALLGRRKLRGV